MPKARFLSLLTIAIAGLITLSACGGNGSSTPPPPPTPTPSSNGLNIYPQTANVPVGGTVDFTGYVPSSTSAVTITWAVSGSSNGSLTSAGVYTAPSSVPSPAQVAVTATSNGLSATAVVTITSAQGITVNPAAASVAAGSTTAFTATGASGAVTWEVNGTQGGDGVHGTIDGSGNYTAPLTPPPGGSTVITAVSGGTSGNSTVTVVYSNASFNGAYGYQYTGDDGSGYFAVVGNLTANSATGTITGTEDLLSGSPSLTTGQSINGTFSFGPDGRGAINLSTSEVWQVALTSSTSASGSPSQHALLINFNQGVTGSGTIDAQTTAPPPLSTPAQHFVFQLAGLDANGNPLGIAGAFTSEGTGALAPSGNVIDINDAGVPSTTILTDDTTLTGSFIPSPGAPAPGALSLNSTDLGEIVRTSAGTSLLFDFYIVSPSHIHVIETDGNAYLSGDVYATNGPQGNSGYTGAQLSAGNYSFALGGSTTVGAYAAGGVLISAGSSSGTSGSITGGVFDNNNGGAEQSQSDATIKSSSYSVDPTTGRVTLSSVGTNQTSGTFNMVGYVAAPDPAFPDVVPPVLLLETDANVIATGTAYLQSAAGTPSGTFAANLTGLGTKSVSEQDILGALGITGTTVSGTLDINNFEVSQQPLLGLNVTSGSSIVSVDTNGRGTATIKAADGAVFTLVYYDVDPNTVVMIDTDSSRVATGTMLKQF